MQKQMKKHTTKPRISKSLHKPDNIIAKGEEAEAAETVVGENNNDVFPEKVERVVGLGRAGLEASSVDPEHDGTRLIRL